MFWLDNTYILFRPEQSSWVYHLFFALQTRKMSKWRGRWHIQTKTVICLSLSVEVHGLLYFHRNCRCSKVEICTVSLVIQDCHKKVHMWFVKPYDLHNACRVRCSQRFVMMSLHKIMLKMFSCTFPFKDCSFNSDRQLLEKSLTSSNKNCSYSGESTNLKMHRPFFSVVQSWCELFGIV